MIIEKVAYDKSTTVACGQEHYRTSSKPKSSLAEGSSEYTGDAEIAKWAPSLKERMSNNGNLHTFVTDPVTTCLEQIASKP